MTTKNVARWVTIGALFIIPFISLYISNGLYFPFITGKNFLFRVLVEIAFAGWIVLAASDTKYRPKFSWTLVALKLMVVWLFIADLFAVNAHKAFWSNYERMDGWVTLIHLYLFFIVAAAVFSAENLWRKWWLAFVGGSAIVTLYGLGQMLHVFAIHQSTNRIDSTLGNSEYLAGYLLFAIAIAIWQAFETREKSQAWLKYSLYVTAALELVVLFETGTRGTLIGLVGAGIVGSILWIREAGKQGRKGAAIVLAILVLIVGGLFVLRDSSFVKNSPNLDRLASTFSLKAALGPRLTIWHMAIEGIEAKPVLGWGQEGYNYIFNKYYEPSLYAQEPWFDRAHDIFLDWSVAGGIPALLIFLGLLGSAVYALMRAPVSRSERILLLSALAGYAVQGLVVFDNLFTYIPLMAILATAHAVSSRPIPYLEKMRTIQDTRLDTIIAPAALVVGVLLIWFVNVPSVRAGSNLINGLTPTNSPEARLASFKQAVANNGFAHQEIAEQLASYGPQAATDSSVSEQTREDIASFANTEMQKQLTETPADARLRLQYALFLRGIGDIKDAEVQSAVAHTLSPSKQTILLEQGIEAFQSQQYDTAKQFFTAAYQLNTAFKDPVAYIAASDISSKQIPAAKALLQQVYGTTSVNEPILLLAYYQIKDWDDLISILQAKYAADNDPQTGFQIAAAYVQAGNLAGAKTQVQKVIAEHPDAAAQGQAILQQLETGT